MVGMSGYGHLSPFLSGRAFIEANFKRTRPTPTRVGFPFLFGGAFIEAASPVQSMKTSQISLPFLGGFH